MEDDPLSIFANQSSPAHKVSASGSNTPVIDEGFRKIDFLKYAAKGGAKVTNTAPAPISKSTSQTSKGLGFGETISSASYNFDASNMTGKASSAIDFLDEVSKDAKKKATSDALEDTIFGKSSSTTKNSMQDEFGFLGRSNSSSTQASKGNIRIKEVHDAEEMKLDDLKASRAVLEKESDDTLDFRIYGRNIAKSSAAEIQAMKEKKEKETIQAASRAGMRDLQEATSQLSELDLLSKQALIPDEEVIKQQKLQAATLAAAALNSAQPMLSTSSSFANSTEEVDIGSLDLDAYLAANSGGSKTGGGLFD